MKFGNVMWLVEEAGKVIDKRAHGHALSSYENLVYCIWVIDNSVRYCEPGEYSDSLNSELLREGRKAAADFWLTTTFELLSLLPRSSETYLVKFDLICEEVRRARYASLERVG